MFLKGNEAERALDLIRLASKGEGNLTPLPELLPAATLPQFIKSSKTRGVEKYTDNWQGGAQVGLGGAGVVLGVLGDTTIDNIRKSVEMDIQDFFDINLDQGISDGVADFLGGGMAEDAFKALTDEIGKSISELGFQVASDVFGSVPIVGQIINGIIKFGQFLYNAIKSSQSSQETVRVYNRISFDPDTDQLVYQEFGARSALDGDWTRVFEPPIGSEQVVRSYGFGVQREDDGTDRVLPYSREDAFIGGGFVPGTRHCLGYTDLMPDGSVKDTGDVLLPTLRQQGIWMWQGYASPVSTRDLSPTIFSVDTEHLRMRWNGYMIQFRKFLEWKKSALPENKRREIIAYYASKNKKGIPEFFGWPTGFIATGYGKSTGDPRIPQEWLSSTQPIKALTALKAQQMAALDTLMCAYVDMRHAAVRSDSEVQAKWRTRREQLLHSPDRFQLDLESVPPDPDYAYESGFYLERLIASGVGTRKGPSGPTIGLATVPKLPSGIDVAQPDVGPGLIAEGRRIKSPMLVALGIAAVGAGGYYIYRQRRKR